ncbi:MAG: hypothetical protein Fur0037_07920 [Planctomycetota bacterium]
MARACLVAVALLAPLAAQQPEPMRILLLDEGRQPVRSARVLFLPDPVPDLPAIGGLLPRPEPRPALPTGSGFSIPSAGGAGALLAMTDAGLGALAVGCRPGEPQVLYLRPMGEVGIPGRSEIVSLWPTWIGPDGDRLRLPPATGQSARLPEGDYEIWARMDRDWIWTRALVRSGRRIDLPLPPRTRKLPLAAENDVHPLNRLDIDLFVGGGDSCWLRGNASLAPMARGAGTGWTLSSSPGSLVEIETDVDRAMAFLLERSSSSWRPIAMAEIRGGRGSIAGPPPQRDAWVLLTARARAPLGVRWTGEPLRARLDPALPLEVVCESARGTDGVVLEHEPVDSPVARQRARTDARGLATFWTDGREGTVLVSDSRFRNAEIPVRRGQSRVRVRLEQGCRIEGKVLRGGEPSGGTPVTLRDPLGRLRPAVRTVLAGADGTFVFEGLSPECDFVLFASERRDGKNWSRLLAPVRADGRTAVLELRCEDPELPRGR